MRIAVSPAAEGEQPIIRRVLEPNAHDTSEFDDRDLGRHGEYGYRCLHHYWVEEIPGNDAAVTLQRRAIPAAFDETLTRSGTAQRFVVEA